MSKISEKFFIKKKKIMFNFSDYSNYNFHFLSR